MSRLQGLSTIPEAVQPSYTEQQLIAAENRRLLDEQQRKENADKSIFGAALDLGAEALATSVGFGSGFPTDPSFSMTGDTILQFKKDYGLNDRELETIASARSMDHANYLALEYSRRNESRRLIEQSGWQGMAAQLAAEVTSFTNIAIMTASAGLTAPGRVASFSTLMLNGLANAAPMAVVEEFKASVDPNITQDQVLKNAAGGFLFQVGVSRFANAKLYGRALAGGIGMATPSMIVDYANGVDTAEALKMASIQFAFGGIFGGLSPRDTQVANRAVENVAKDATKIHLLLPPPPSKVVYPEGMIPDMPPSLTYGGYSLLVDQMSQNEKNAFGLIFGFNNETPQNIVNALNNAGIGQDQLRQRLQQLQERGLTPMGAISVIALELQAIGESPLVFTGPTVPRARIRINNEPLRGRWQPQSVEMPVAIEFGARGSGDQIVTSNLNDQELAAIQIITGTGIPNPVVMNMAAESLGVPADRVPEIVNNMWIRYRNRGYTADEAVKLIGNKFGVAKVPAVEPLTLQEAPAAAAIAREELAAEQLAATDRSYTNRVSDQLERVFPEGGDAFAVATQGGAVRAGIEGMNELTDAGNVLLTLRNAASEVWSEFQDLNAARVAKGLAPFTDKKLANMLGKVIEGMSKEDQNLFIAFTKNGADFDGLSESQLRTIAEAAGINESKIAGKNTKQLVKLLNDEIAVETPRAQRRRIQQLADLMTGGTTLQIPEITGAGVRLVDIEKLGQDTAARLRQLNEPRVKAGKNPLGMKKAMRIAQDLGAGDDAEVVARLAMVDNDLTKLNLTQLKSVAKQAGVKPQAMRKMDTDAIIKMIESQREGIKAARTAKPTAISATEPQIIASTGILKSAEDVGDRMMKNGLKKLSGFGNKLRSGFDPEEITAAIQVLVGAVMKYGAKGLSKADAIIRMTIEKEMPHLIGQTDRLLALTKAALNTGKNASGEFDVNTFVSNAAAAQAAVGAVAVDSNRGYDGFYPDMEEKGMSFLGAKWVPRLAKKALFPFTHFIGSSSDSDVRMLGAALVTDFIPKHVNGVIQTAREGAYQWVKSKVEATDAFFKIAMHNSYKKYVVEAQAAKTAPMTQAEFRKQVALAARRPDDKSFSPAIREAADAFRANVKRTLVVMAKHKVAGAVEVLKNMDDDWVKRMPDTNVVMQLRDKYGAKFINEMVYESIIKAGSSEKVRRAIADAWVQNALGIGGGSAHLNMNPQTLYERVKAILPNASEKDLREIKNALLPGSDENIKIGGLKNRIWMDETKVHVAPNGDKLTLEDLLVNDIDVLMNSVARTAYGAAAEQAILSDFGAKVGQEFTSSDDIIRYLKNKFASEGYSGSIDDMNDDITNLENAFKLVRGYPIHTLDPKMRSFTSSIGHMNFTGSMSNVASGLTNYMEVGSGAVQAGVNYFLQAYPEATRIFKEIVIDKKIDSKMAREMVAMGFGVNRLNRNLGVDIVHAGVVSSTLEKVTAKGARLASDISLQSFGQDHLELATAMGLQQNLIDTAMTTGKIDFSEFKTRSMGWTDEDVGIIMQQLKKHADQTSEGVWAANLDKWDVEAATQASKYASGIRMTVNRAIQKGDLTQLPLWFSSPAGRLIMQLKTFNYQATVNKLAFNIKGISSGDMSYAHDMVSSSVMAALGFIGSVYIRSFGMDEETKKQYLDDNLNMRKVLLASASRAAWSGSIPTFVDTAFSSFGAEEPFSGMKNSTNIGNIVTGNMTYQQAVAIGSIPKALRHWINDDEVVTQSDMKGVSKAIWMPNIIGMKNYFNRLISDLPKNQPRVFSEEQ